MSDNDKQSEYEVGYKKPPKHTQFKKGQSGNPKGRPKGSNNLKTDVLNTLKATVPITIDGQKRNISTQKAMLMRLKEKALKGDAKALDRLIALAGAYNNEELDAETRDQLAPSDAAIIDNFLSRRGGAAALRQDQAEDESQSSKVIDEAHRLSGIEDELEPASVDDTDDEAWLK